ncbi:hypothetical protein [Aliivibrio kagoshimensis]|uniref:hypothetical protein n=1 Tax=Aliivibrio kagoshimensis TaxID=2910230 RepID=UPI003D0FFED3
MIIKKIWFSFYTLLLMLLLGITEAAGENKKKDDCYDVSHSYTTDVANEDLFVVAQISYGEEALSNELFIYMADGKLYFPLQFLSELLLLPIQVNIEDLTAEGWFNDPQHTIVLSDHLMKFPVNNEDCKAANSEVYFDDWDIYLEQSIFEQMLGLVFHYQVAQQHLKIAESEGIPLSQIRERNAKLTKYNNKNNHQAVQYHHFPDQYAALGDPTLYIDVGFSALDQNNHRDQYSDGSLQTRFDALGHSIYGNYSWGPSEQDTTFYLEREQSDYWMKHYRIGEINSHSLPLVSSADEGVGGTVQMGDGFTDDIRSITVSGESLPGWDVELYRNSNLVALQRVGSDGLYSFKEVPFFIGINQYQLRFYGPNGEQKIESFSRMLDSSVMEKGNVGLISGYVERERDELREYYARAHWAALDAITFGLGLTSQETSENQWQLLPNLSSDIITDSTYWQLNYAQSDDGYAMSAAVQGHHADVDWQADWVSYHDFNSWSNINGLSKYESNVSLNSGIDSMAINYGITGRWQENTNGYQNWYATANVSSRAYELLINNSIQMSGSDATQRWIDTVSLSGRYSDWYLRTYAEFLLNDAPGLTKIGLNTNVAFGRAWNYQAELLYLDASETNQYTLKNSVSYASDFGTLRLALDATELGDWRTQLRWSSSLLWDVDEGELYVDRLNYVTSGAVMLQAFEDNNLNGYFDEDEVAIEGLRFVGHKNSKQKTDENGKLLVRHLQTSKDHQLILDNTSLSDPFLLPDYSALSVATHSGHIQNIPFPVVFTSELEGSVSLKKKEESVVSSGLHVELKDLYSGVTYETWVEYDGVFIFDQLRPGAYHLLINGKSAENIVELVPGDYVELGEYVILIAEAEEKQS